MALHIDIMDSQVHEQHFLRTCSAYFITVSGKAINQTTGKVVSAFKITYSQCVHVSYVDGGIGNMLQINDIVCCTTCKSLLKYR